MPTADSDRDRNFRQRLPSETARWQAAGIISPEQADAIRAFYPAGDDIADSAPGNALAGRTVSVIAIMGAALVGLGIIAFIAANWSGIPTAGRLALLLGGTPAIYAAGWLLAHPFGYPRVGTAVILLGAIAYGASIHLIAQIYHLPLYHPSLLPAWFLGVLPLAYIERSRALLMLGLILFLAAAIFRAQVWLPGLDGTPTALAPGYLALGALLFAAGRWHSRIDALAPLARFYDLAGLLIAATIIYLAGYHSLWAGGDLWISTLPTAEYWAVTAIATLAAAALVGYAGRIRPRAIRWEAAALIMMGAAAALLWIGAAWGALWFRFLFKYIWILFNLLLLGAVIGMIAAGYRWNRAWLINLAVALFAVTLFTRYFEFGFGLLEQSLAFIIVGVILLAGGFGLEHLRRRMLRGMTANAAAGATGRTSE